MNKDLYTGPKSYPSPFIFLYLCVFFRANPVCTVHSTNMAAKVVRIVLEKPLIICQIIEKSIIVLFFAANGNKHNA